jgi:hypothetical protein
MVAETLTAVQAGSRHATGPGVGWNSFLVPVYGEYNVAANVEDGDIFEMCWTPAKFLCLGGWWNVADLDTGTEVLDLMLGWAANGGSTETLQDQYGVTYTNSGGTADPDGLVAASVFLGDAVVGVQPAGLNYRPIILPRALFFSRPTKIQIEANVAANAFTAGYTSVTLLGRIIG